MLFNSYIFILLFLPVTLCLYYGFLKAKKEKLAKTVLIAMSLWFYGYFHISYLLLLVGSVLVNYVFSKMLVRENWKKFHKLLLVVGLLSNVVVLFWFKYYDFFVENVSALLGREPKLLGLLMPLGISFFTFQQIAYLVDSYRGETKDNTFLEYALFVTFFPKLASGPIVLHGEIIPQFREEDRKNFSQESLAEGLWMFAAGLAKKVLIADTLGRGADWGFGNILGMGAMDTALVALCYSLQIYFDFSSYTDMAIGVGKMFRFDLPVNFNSPYKAVSMLDFWQRWHISLTRFLRKYIYFPLGGSRKGNVRTYFNILFVFFVSGIWHGANWTFILWGLLHGVFQVLNRAFAGIWDKVPGALRRVATFIVVTLLWILFRANSVEDAVHMYGNLLKPWNLEVSGGFLGQFDVIEFTYLEEHIGFLGSLIKACPALHVILVLGVAMWIVFGTKNMCEKTFKPGLANALATIVFLVWSVMSLSGISTFLYLNF